MDNKFYRIGLDIGVASVGYAVLENDPTTENPCKILKMGVRTFDANEKPDSGESTAKARREKRGVRRRNRRRAFRFERMKKLLDQTFLIDCEKDLQALINQDVYELRSRALDEKISNIEIAKVVLNLLKHRGFKSNRKSQEEQGDVGKLLNAIKDNTNFMQENGYRTIGEAIYKHPTRFKTVEDGRTIYAVRNSDGNYKNCFLRVEVVSELKAILNKQQELGNNCITSEFINKATEILERQRNFDEGPGKGSKYSASFKVGNCTFIPTEKRAPKSSYTFEYFTALSKINSLRIDGSALTPEHKNILVDYVKECKELTFTQVRKFLSLPIDQTFNLCNYLNRKDPNVSEEAFIAQCEKKTFVTMKNSYSIRKSLNLTSSYNNKELLNEVALMLSTCKSDVTIQNYAQNNLILSKLTNEEIEKVSQLNFDKFGSLSIVAMDKIIPYLEQGLRYDEAAKAAGFNHSSFSCDKMQYLKGSIVDEALADITSNVVKRSVNQTLRVLNEIIKTYGSPQYVTIELARDLSRDYDDRKKVQKRQLQNYEENEKSKGFIKEEFKLTNPSHFDVVKYRLYQEQNCKCMYSGKTIDINRLYEPNYVQVDHILPISRSMDDSYNNKVLVLASENQNKGNQTPYEFFGNDSEKWNSFVARVQLINNLKKRKNLLNKSLSEEQSKDFIARNINDTRYISKFLLQLMDRYLQVSPAKHTKQIRSVNGGVTSYLRKCWGINKLREDGDLHHCIDAAVIATVSSGQIKNITTFNKFKESYIDNKDGTFINRKTKSVITEQEKQEYEKQGLEILSKMLPQPYPHFTNELSIRAKTNYYNQTFTEEEKLALAKLGYTQQELAIIKPVFVSKMKTKKTTGPIHKETMMSSREYSKTQRLIKTVTLDKLKLQDVPEEIELKGDNNLNVSIKDYYNPSDDRLLYLKLKEYLIANGKIAKDTIFHKPKKDGSDGPVVKKVKVYEKSTNCVITPNGAAANDKMYRVDVYEKSGKFYLCPVYMADIYVKKLPNKLIVQSKPWIDIDDTYNFKFSLYKNDLVKVISKREITLSKCIQSQKSTKPNNISNKEFLLYYNSTGISTASITLKTNDGCYEITSLGVKNLSSIEKYYVDTMGKIYKAPQEQREGF